MSPTEVFQHGPLIASHQQWQRGSGGWGGIVYFSQITIISMLLDRARSGIGRSPCLELLFRRLGLEQPDNMPNE